MIKDAIGITPAVLYIICLMIKDAAMSFLRPIMDWFGRLSTVVQVAVIVLLGVSLLVLLTLLFFVLFLSISV